MLYNSRVQSLHFGEIHMEKLRLMIAGSEYVISTDDDPDYVTGLAAKIDERIKQIMSSSSRASVTQAAILVALEYADEASKGAESAVNLRSQIQEYLEDAARAKTDAEISKREAERLAKELSALRASKS